MTQKPGRPRKFTEEELHQRLVQAGIETLTRHGLSDGLAAVRLDTAIADSGVPRRAAYQHLETDTDTLPQEELRRQVLLAIFRDHPPGSGAEATRAFAVEEIAKHEDALTSRDPERVDAARHEICRRMANFNAAIDAPLPWWAVFSAAAGASATRRDRDPELVAAMQDSVEMVIGQFSELYAYVASVIHLELRPGCTLREFAVAALASSAGLNQIGSIDKNSKTIDSDAGEWSILAFTMDALVGRFFQSTLDHDG